MTDLSWMDRWVNDRAGHFMDGWRINRVEGDCNDFALTAAHDIAGGWFRLIFMMATLQIVMWQAWSKPVWRPTHTVLWVRGRGWIDSSDRRWRDDHLQILLFLPLTALPLLAPIIWATPLPFPYKVFILPLLAWPVLRVLQGLLHQALS